MLSKYPASHGMMGANRPTLYADFMSGSLILGRGGVLPSFTNTTVRTITDQDLVVRQVLSGEARFGGFRRVRNWCFDSQDVTSAFWTKTAAGTGSAPVVTANYTAAPDGTLTADRVQFDRGAGASVGDVSLLTMANNTPTAFGNNCVSVWLKTNDGTTKQIAFSIAGANEVILNVTGIWIRYSVFYAPSNIFNGRIGLRGNIATSQTADLAVWGGQHEDTTGQSNQNPAEYVSVGVLSAPYQGANVDGVQYFPYLNGNTVASNVVTEARGANISSSILGGYLPEPAATQLVTPLASVRNLTDASWVKTSCTAAQTAVGADGVANKGSTITGTAINWTCLQTLVAAATSRTVSMLVRRRTGTGAIFLLQNATALDITAAINSTTYTLVQLNANVLNSAFGIGGSVSGDAVDVDFVQFEAGNVTGLVNSRIPDSISVRSADVLTYATTGWLNAAAGTLYAEFFNSTNTGASAISAVLNNGTANNFVRTYRSSTGGTAFADVADGGVTQSNLSVGAVATGAPQKIVSVYQANDFAGFVNNTSLGTDVAGTIPALTQLDIGHQNGGALLGHYVRKVAYYPIRMLSGTAQGLTL